MNKYIIVGAVLIMLIIAPFLFLFWISDLISTTFLLVLVAMPTIGIGIGASVGYVRSLKRKLSLYQEAWYKLAHQLGEKALQQARRSDDDSGHDTIAKAPSAAAMENYLTVARTMAMQGSFLGEELGCHLTVCAFMDGFTDEEFDRRKLTLATGERL